MNANKQPRHFIGQTVKRAAWNGYNVNKPLATLDGDDVVIHAIDTTHGYPIIGEVKDHNGGVAWLARWNVAGQYKGTPEATSKHSFEKNEGLKVDLRISKPVIGPHIHVDTTGREAFSIKFLNVFPKVSKPVSSPVAEFDKAFNEAVAATAPAPRLSLKAQLGRVYASALAVHSLQEVAFTAYHVDNLIEQGRLRFPMDDLGTADYLDLKEGVLRVLRHPGRMLEWVE